MPKLRYAVNDARSIEAALLGQGFRRDRIIALLDAQATKSRIETVLGDGLRQKVGGNDRVFVFFAGHGKTDRLRDRRYTVRIGEPIRVEAAGERATLERWVRVPERTVRAHPDQWSYFYDVWSPAPAR